MYSPTVTYTTYFSTQTDYRYPFYVKESGTQFSSSVKYSYSINNGTAVHQSATVNHNGGNINCVNAMGLSMYRIALKAPLHFNTPGKYTLKIWIDSIDGTPFTIVDTLVRKIKALDNLTPRKGLSEYYFHVACGPCGEDGTPYVEQMIENFDDYNVLVKLHNSYGGPAQWALMDVPETQMLEDTLNIVGHPNFDRNRTSLMPFDNTNHYYPYLGFCPLDSNFITKDVIYQNKVPSNLYITNTQLNNNSNILSFTANAKFLDTLNFSTKVRLGCMLVEDSIYGFQNNNGIASIPDTVFHRFVLRKSYGGVFGKPNSVASSVNTNQVASISFTDTLPSNFNKKKLYLIPTLHYYSPATSNYEVVNVRKYKIRDLLNSTSLAERAEDSYFEVYPNPASNMVQVRCSMPGKNLTLTLLDVVGRKVYQENVSNAANISISVASLAKGTYLMTLSNGKEQANKTIVVE